LIGSREGLYFDPMKRALGFLSTLLLLHLTVAPGRLVCAKHGADSSAAENVAVSNGHHQHEHHHAGTTGHTEQRDEAGAPAPQGCCGAMASCSPTIVAVSVASAGEDVYSRQARPSKRDDFALTRVTAPETPPPKV
jgi:hypothetical protein